MLFAACSTSYVTATMGKFFRKEKLHFSNQAETERFLFSYHRIDTKKFCRKYHEKTLKNVTQNIKKQPEWLPKYPKMNLRV